MGVISKGLCNAKLGPHKNDVCYEKAGHSGKCFSSFGRKLEYEVQEVLKFAGRSVVSSTRREDEVLKVDFWVECSREECFLLADRGYVPIQFTINRDAANGEKGINAINGDGNVGVPIVWISAATLSQWKNAPSEDARKSIALKITEEFLCAVDRAVTLMSYLGVGLKPPPICDIRFEKQRDLVS